MANDSGHGRVQIKHGTGNDWLQNLIKAMICFKSIIILRWSAFYRSGYWSWSGASITTKWWFIGLDSKLIMPRTGQLSNPIMAIIGHSSKLVMASLGLDSKPITVLIRIESFLTNRNFWCRTPETSLLDSCTLSRKRQMSLQKFIVLEERSLSYLCMTTKIID